MTDKIGHIKNPLTIIAVFAGLAEVGGTAVLPLLETEVQSIYVWFLMFFPTILVGVFFFVLYKKHHVLYAPSDFRDDATFRAIIQGQVTTSPEVSLTADGSASSQASAPSLDQLTADSRKVLKTLWTFQNRQFPNNDANRWAFGIALGSPDYLEYQRGAQQLSEQGLARVGPRGLCYLTNRGLEYCRANAEALNGHNDLWETFSN